MGFGEVFNLGQWNSSTVGMHIRCLICGNSSGTARQRMRDKPIEEPHDYRNLWHKSFFLDFVLAPETVITAAGLSVWEKYQRLGKWGFRPTRIHLGPYGNIVHALKNVFSQGVFRFYVYTRRYSILSICSIKFKKIIKIFKSYNAGIIN